MAAEECATLPPCTSDLSAAKANVSEEADYDTSKVLTNELESTPGTHHSMSGEASLSSSPSPSTSLSIVQTLPQLPAHPSSSSLTASPSTTQHFSSSSSSSLPSSSTSTPTLPSSSPSRQSSSSSPPSALAASDRLPSGDDLSSSDGKLILESRNSSSTLRAPSPPLAPLLPPPTSSSSSSSTVVRIRDFGFKMGDPRHEGIPYDTNSHHHGHASSPSSTTQDWSIHNASSLFGTSSSSSSSSNNQQQGLGGGGGGGVGYGWSFMAAGAAQLEGSRLSFSDSYHDGKEEDDDDEDDDDEDEADEDRDEDEEREREEDGGHDDMMIEEQDAAATARATAEDTNMIQVGGLYVAAYDFKAESESEMNLTHGDVIRVHFRVCDGWIVASKIRVAENGTLLVHDGEVVDDEAVGLCPENFVVPY